MPPRPSLCKFLISSKYYSLLTPNVKVSYFSLTVSYPWTQKMQIYLYIYILDNLEIVDGKIGKI